ncbi:hypothetical protein A8431_003112 [Escherichia coli]|nr:hypothetical protein [Escherichia coli]
MAFIASCDSAHRQPLTSFSSKEIILIVMNISENGYVDLKNTYNELINSY